MRVRSGWAVAAAALAALLFAGVIARAEGATRPPLPAGAHKLAPGQLPRQCTVKDGALNAYGMNPGYYFSTAANTWISAPWCYPRWGNLEASPSQITRDGGKVTVTAIPTEGSNSAEWAPKTKSITWTYPGKRVAGCGKADMSCTVIVSRAPGTVATEWQWFEFHVSMPRTFFIDSPGEFCAGVHACPGNATQAWSYVGIGPGGTKPKKPTRSRAASRAAWSRRTAAVRLQAHGALRRRGHRDGPGRHRAHLDRDSGNYTVKVDKGSWTVTPALGDREFDPLSDSVSVSANGHSVASFKTCEVHLRRFAEPLRRRSVWTVPGVPVALAATVGGAIPIHPLGRTVANPGRQPSHSGGVVLFRGPRSCSGLTRWRRLAGTVGALTSCSACACSSSLAVLTAVAGGRRRPGLRDRREREAHADREARVADRGG